jgi:dolichyl-phosphate beta-glucosyltransferase
MSDSVELSLVVPCYNDAGYLAESTSRIIRALDEQGIRFEMIFVDDHSMDQTRAVVEELVASDSRCRAVYHEVNRGRGSSFRSGALIARGQIVGFADIDLEVHERFIADMVQAIRQGADVATGWRRIKLSLRPYDLVRHAMSVGYASLYRQLLRLPTRDPETGFKFFRRGALHELLQHATASGWFFDSEVMAYSTLLGLRLDEVPCDFIRRADKRSSVRLVRSTVQQTRELVRFALALRRERYARRAGRHATARSDSDATRARDISAASEHRYRLPAGRLMEAVRGPIVSREVPEGLRIKSRLEASAPGVSQPSRDLFDRRERV